MDETDKIPHRGHEVLEVLARFGGSARNAQIAHALGVSEETIRRLVRSLAQAGKVERVHGGTYLSHPQDAPIYSSALEKNAPAKSAIAQKAAELIEDKMTVREARDGPPHRLARDLQHLDQIRRPGRASQPLQCLQQLQPAMIDLVRPHLIDAPPENSTKTHRTVSIPVL